MEGYDIDQRAREIVVQLLKEQGVPDHRNEDTPFKGVARNPVAEQHPLKQGLKRQ